VEACSVTLVCYYHHEQSQVLAKAMTYIIYLAIPIEFMEKWLNEFKSWHYFVIKTYRSRYEELLKTINETAFKNMDERLEWYLRNQAKHNKQITLTHQQIANDLSSSREVISRLLKKLENRQMVVLHRNFIEWLEPVQ
jgi:CRP/FNR family transcriptional regulator